MPALKENFLLIGPWDPTLKEIGARIVPSLGPERVDLEHVHVLAVSVTVLLEKKFQALKTEALAANPSLQVVAVVPPGYPSDDLVRLQRTHQLFGVLAGFQFAEAEPALYRALEHAQKLDQEELKVALLLERQKKLETLRDELELNVEKRTRLFTESRHNLLVRSLRLEGLRKTLEAIQEADSIAEMEKALSESLASTADVSWVRILLTPQNLEFEKQIAPMKDFAHLAIPLWLGSHIIGSVFYMRPAQLPFRKETSDFLAKITDAVGLAVDRLQTRSETDSLKEQWQITFQAVSDPIALIDEDYEVVQANSPSEAGGRCFERIFGRTQPCEGCGRGGPFRLTYENRVWDVQSQFKSLEPEQPGLYINRYTEVTDTLALEKRMVDQARKVELGTIGSSIAHELNNPLGGILNFAQLMQMDLPSDHPMREDIERIEEGARRCKDIVENLLAFTRAPRAEELRDLDLREALQKSVQIQSSRLKSLGLIARIDAPSEPVMVRGPYNGIVQAFSALLTQSLDMISLTYKNDPSFRGRVQWKIENIGDMWVVTLIDNGAIETAAQLAPWNLKSTEQLLANSGARVEFPVASSPDYRAKISFPRPVLRT